MTKLFLGIFMALVCATQGCIADDEPKGITLGVGDTLPEFSVMMSDGNMVSTTNLYGKVSMIVFFNTDCSDCQKELPVVQQVWQYFEGNPNIVVAPIAREESNEQILKYWQENGLSMPYSPQETRDVYSLFAPSVIPRIYISDTNGVITAAYGDSEMPDYSTLVTAIEETRNNSILNQ